MKRIVILDPQSSDPTWGLLDEAAIIEVPDDLYIDDVLIRDWLRHPVFVTDDGVVPICDICSGPQRVEGDDWNGETGNHFSCEENR